MVSAELALVIPGLVAVLALCLAGLGLAVDQIRCADAARVAVRAAARAEPVEVVHHLALSSAPAGSQVEVSREGQDVRVTVTAPSRSRPLPGLPQASASAVARLEPFARAGPP